MKKEDVWIAASHSQESSSYDSDPFAPSDSSLGIWNFYSNNSILVIGTDVYIMKNYCADILGLPQPSSSLYFYLGCFNQDNAYKVQNYQVPIPTCTNSPTSVLSRGRILCLLFQVGQTIISHGRNRIWKGFGLR